MPVDPACQVLQDRIDVLTDQVDALEEMHQQPGLTPSERAEIIRQIDGIRAQIAVLQAQLTECLSQLSVHGVELTQGIQFFLINGQGSGAGADNSMPLIAERALVLRVYPDANFKTPSPGSLQLAVWLGGYVRVDRVLDAGGFQPVKMLTPVNGTIAARPVQAIDRANPNHSLNFRLDPVDCQGTLRFTVTVFPAGPLVSSALAGAVTGISASSEIYGQFEPGPAFRLRFVPIHYTGHGQDVPPPPALAAVTVLRYLLSTYPIGRLELSDCTPADFGGDLDTFPGAGCGLGWDELLFQLRCMQAASDPRAIYVATLAPEVETGSVAGCGGDGVAAAVVNPLDMGTAITMAQEVGHALGRQHAPIGGAPNPDPNFPHYDGFQWGSIGEFGFDTVTSQVYDPAIAIDFMGYCPDPVFCPPRWISPYTYTGLSQAIASRFGAAMSDSLAARIDETSGETLYLGFRIQRDNLADIRPSFHLRGASPLLDQADPSDVTVELRDAEGQLIVARRCHPLAPHHQQSDEAIEFFEPVPWWPQAATIVILRGREPVATAPIEPTAPDLVIDAVPSELGTRATAEISWTVHHAERPVTCLLRYSNDAGQTWRSLAANLKETRYRLNPEFLPGGSECLFEIIATSGVRTTVARTASVTVPVKPRRAHILAPARDLRSRTGSAVLLRGGGYSPDFGLGAPNEVRWSSSIDGPLGRGFEVLARMLSAGTHEIRLEVPDGLGGTSTAVTSVSVAESPRSE